MSESEISCFLCQLSLLLMNLGGSTLIDEMGMNHSRRISTTQRRVTCEQDENLCSRHVQHLEPHLSVCLNETHFTFDTDDVEKMRKGCET